MPKLELCLGELVPATGIQADLFSTLQPNPKSDRLMQAMDLINRKMGKESIKMASEGFKRPWKMKQENKSPCYTTNWDELLKVD